MDAAADTLAAAAVQLETIPKFPYLVAAYASFFVIIVLFVISIHRRESALRARVESLEKQVGRGDGA